MRILLDENFPADFSMLLVDHEVFTVHALGYLPNGVWHVAHGCHYPPQQICMTGFLTL
jgi:hypothetical protein